MKALVVYIGTGNGFKTPAISIGKELKKKGVKVNYSDFYEGLGLNSIGAFSKWIWRFFLKFPFLFYLLITVTDFPFVKEIQRIFTYFFLGLKKKIARQLKKENPNFLLITDFLSYHHYVHFIRKYHLPIKIFYYNSDVVFGHRMFINNCVDQAFVSTEDGYKSMILKGMQESKLIQTSFPIDEKYKRKFDSVKNEREKLKLKNQFTLLFSAGGEGIGGIKLLKAICKADLNVQLIVVCGKNQQGIKQVNILKQKYPKQNLIAKGFIHNMQEYLYCCDLNIGKAGMNSIFESIFFKKPFISIKAMPNEINVEKYLLKNNLGWRIRHQNHLIKLLKNLKNDVNKISEKQENMKLLKIDFTTEKIANKILAYGN